MANWLGDWKYRRKITIDKDKIDAALTHFPVLLKLGDEVGIGEDDVTSIFTELGANSKKIAITKSDGETQIYAEIERWAYTGVAANAVAEIWVSKSDLSISNSADTELYIYYDSTKADNTDYIGDTQSTPAKAVWDSNFRLRSDMKDKTTSTIEDSTSNVNHGTKSSANNPLQADGKIGKAQDFSEDNIDITSSESLGLTDAITLEATIKADSVSGSGKYIIHKGGVSTTGINYMLVIEPDKMGFYFYPGSWKYLNDTTALSTNTWYYLAVTYDKNNIRFYINGVAKDSGAQTAAMTTNTRTMQIGKQDHSNNLYFDGIIDEVRVSSSARSAAWIKATYNTGNDSLITWGDEETPSVTGTNMQVNVGGTLKNVASAQVRVNNAWKNVAGASINKGGSWKKIF
jgi:hypothetical protein